MAESLLTVGTQVPDVTVTDQDGNEVSTKDFRGKKLIVYFYPKDNTPGCTAEACSLRDHYQTFLDKGYQILGVSPDSEKSHQKFRAKYDLPFPLLSDPDNKLIKAFGAWGEKKMYGKTYMGLLRSTFVVNKDGKITHVVPKVQTKQAAEQLLEMIEG